MIRKVTLYGALLTLLFMLSGCANAVVVQEEVQRRASTGESWTIMMYMCGSTMEEDCSRAGEVLGSLSCDLPENVNVLVETGGSRKWSVEDVYPDYLQYFAVQRNGIRLVQQTASASMGESSTLADFLIWGSKNYPADHYMAIIWDHGGGPLGGVAYDSQYGFDSLSLTELTNALERTNIKLDIIGFDASLMSNLETASAVAMYADYMVASEDIMPMSGWDYESLFEFISENPSSGAADIAAFACDGVLDNAGDEEEYFVSMAVTDLSDATMLSLAFDGMAQTMSETTADIASLRGMGGALKNLEYLGCNSRWEGYSNLADLGQMAQCLENSIGRPAENLQDAVSDMVVYKTMGEYRQSLSGLGVYYPGNTDGNELSAYSGISPSRSYVDFIERMAVGVELPQRVSAPEDCGAWAQYSGLAADNVLTASSDISGKFVLTVSHPEILKNACVNFYMYSAKDSQYVYIYSDYNTVFDSASGGYVYECTGLIPELNGTPVSMYLISSGVNYDVYSIPVMYKGEMSNLRVIKSKQGEDEGEYTVFGLYKGMGQSSGMADRQVISLGTGDVITPLYEIYGENSSKYIEGSAIRIGFSDLKIADKRIGDNDYIISYTAEDIYGVRHDSNTAALTAAGGNVRIITN